MEKKKKKSVPVPVPTKDRISELPQHILHHHILSLLPQEEAVRTCILSKSWRHLGPTRPKLEFRESHFTRRGSEEKFISAVENTLQRYVDQNLSIQELTLVVWKSDPNETVSLLNKWIPIVIMKNTGLKKLTLSAVKISLPLNVVFQAEFLEELFLGEFSLTQIYNSTGKLKRLRTLSLVSVFIKEEFLNNLSSHFPCLEELELNRCFGISEFKLSSHTIKRLIIRTPDRPIKAAFDTFAANMLHFEFRSSKLPPIFSFATTRRECKSRVDVWSLLDFDPTWLQKLHEILKALSQSQISLNISFPSMYGEAFCRCCVPVVVEHLCINEHYSPSRFQAILNSLFHICRPRYIALPFSPTERKIFDSILVESVWKTLVNKGEMRQQDFENKNEWYPVNVPAMSNYPHAWFYPYAWFRLKWRDLS